MNNTVLAGIIVGAVALAGAGAILVNSSHNPWQQYAKVVSVEPAFDVTRTPRQVCGDEATLAREGGLSSGADAATPAAPVAPAAEAPEAAAPTAGKKEEAGAVAETDCLVVYDTRSVEAGFDVTYELDGLQKVVRMDHDPGNRIPVENGELVLSMR
ncbi:MAG TPA: hypothetical protein VJL86_13870 [Steroidobacteraceae bacterium]|nr:hypothetical protein [Steroidobacteraceae bacterium]